AESWVGVLRFGLGRLVRFFYVAFFWVAFLFLFLFEIRFAPQHAAEWSFIHARGVDDDVVLEAGLEVGMAKIEGGGLQRIEQEAGGFRVHLSADEEAHDVHEANLNGVGVLEDRELADQRFGLRASFGLGAAGRSLAPF